MISRYLSLEIALIIPKRHRKRTTVNSSGRFTPADVSRLDDQAETANRRPRGRIHSAIIKLYYWKRIDGYVTVHGDSIFKVAADGYTLELVSLRLIPKNIPPVNKSLRSGFYSGEDGVNPTVALQPTRGDFGESSQKPVHLNKQQEA